MFRLGCPLEESADVLGELALSGGSPIAVLYDLWTSQYNINISFKFKQMQLLKYHGRTVTNENKQGEVIHSRMK